jgi:5'-3' exonuclease
MAAERQRYRSEKYGNSNDDRPKPYVFFHINILREYLTLDLAPTEQLRFAWNIERAIDDWIFLCYFVGNDFLPHMPSLEIREGAIDRLVNIWKEALPSFDDYMTRDGDTNIDKICQIMNALGLVEDEIFKERKKGNDYPLIDAQIKSFQRTPRQTKEDNVIQVRIRSLWNDLYRLSYAPRLQQTIFLFQIRLLWIMP